MNNNNKQLGNSKIIGQPEKKLNLIIADKSITPDKLSDSTLDKIDEIAKRNCVDLQNQINSYNQHGTFISNEFGNNPYIGISQKTLTAAFTKLWEKLEDITGELYHGINMIVSPTYFIGETGCDVTITASSNGANGIFEHIAFLANGVLVGTADNVETYTTVLHIDDTTEIECVAKIMGITYTQSQTITHYASFFIGGGTNYSNIMNRSFVVPVREHLRGAYDINCSQGDHIIIVMGESLASGFIRADMNGFEIMFNKRTVTVGSDRYVVYTSENIYDAGSYNIDING